MDTTNLNILTNSDYWSFENDKLIWLNPLFSHTPDLINEASAELSALLAINDPMPCGHAARYAVTSDEGTSWCCMCELEAERWPEKIVSHE